MVVCALKFFLNEGQDEDKQDSDSEDSEVRAFISIIFSTNAFASYLVVPPPLSMPVSRMRPMP